MIEQYLAFAIFAFVASVTPGPNNVIMTATGARVGIVGGLPALFGIAIGFALMIFVLTLGLGTAILLQPTALTVLRVCGIAMLLWLAWQIAFAPVALMDADAESPKRFSIARPVGFAGAAAFQWLNPKAWVITASVISAYMTVERPPLAQAVAFAAIFLIAGLSGCFPWLAFGAVIRRWLTTPKTARIFNYTMGLLLVATILLIVA